MLYFISTIVLLFTFSIHSPARFIPSLFLQKYENNKIQTLFFESKYCIFCCYITGCFINIQYLSGFVFTQNDGLSHKNSFHCKQILFECSCMLQREFQCNNFIRMNGLILQLLKYSLLKSANFPTNLVDNSRLFYNNIFGHSLLPMFPNFIQDFKSYIL